MSPPPWGQTYRFTLVCRQSASASVTPCGQDYRKAMGPRLTKLIHRDPWGHPSILSNFRGRDLIFKVTRGHYLRNFCLRTRFQESHWAQAYQTHTYIPLGPSFDPIKFWGSRPHFQGHQGSFSLKYLLADKIPEKPLNLGLPNSYIGILRTIP